MTVAVAKNSNTASRHEVPPQNDELSNKTILLSFSNSMLGADISTPPPPTRVTWSLFVPSILTPLASAARNGLPFVAQHVLGTCYACYATEDHAIQKRLATQSVVPCTPLTTHLLCRGSGTGFESDPMPAGCSSIFRLSMQFWMTEVAVAT